MVLSMECPLAKGSFVSSLNFTPLAIIPHHVNVLITHCPRGTLMAIHVHIYLRWNMVMMLAATDRQSGLS